MELGSGTGILGMIASKPLYNCKCVAMTDGDEKVISLLHQNLSNPNNEIDETVAKAHALLWGDFDDDDVQNASKSSSEESNERNGNGCPSKTKNSHYRKFEQWCRSSWPRLFYDYSETAKTDTNDCNTKKDEQPHHHSSITIDDNNNKCNRRTLSEDKDEKLPVVLPEESKEEEGKVVFDCILAGDVLYKSNLPLLFFQTVSRYLSRKADSALYLCHIPRAGITHERVVRAAQDAGLIIEEFDDVGCDDETNPKNMNMRTLQEMVINSFCDDDDGDDYPVVEKDDVLRAKIYHVGHYL